MAQRQLRSVEQIGMDERVVDDPPLQGLLEKRLRLYDDKAEISKAYKNAHEDAKDAAAKHEIAEGTAIRVGRFRIERKPVAARSVSFTADATSRLVIGLWADEE